MGSSPLARGPHDRHHTKAHRGGLIPARAGTTWRRMPGQLQRTAHPRSRGDHTLKGNRHEYHSGAHPRSRGDHFILSARLLWRMGSSPLARGPHDRHHTKAHRGGLIPARAGTTTRWLRVACRLRAHPRSRGDHSVAVLIIAGALGSSPLARGPRNHLGKRRHVPGLIPARAGTTPPDDSYRLGVRAHPRSRGDHLAENAGAAPANGSSPLARGPHPERKPP